MSFRDHFSGVAAGYARYRPRYPRALVDLLVANCPRRELAWEAGCGSGQLSVPLGEHFARVIATDPAQAQLAQAEAHAHVEYRCAPAEHSGLPDACADLAVAAQAAHWFEWDAYVAEVARVARPGALVAVIAYDNPSADGELGDLLVRHIAELGAYWPPQRQIVLNGYRDLVWPWPEVAAPELEMTVRWTRAELIGYIATWSATQRCIAAEGRARYEAMCAELARIWPGDEPRETRWPLAIRLARR